MAAPQFQFTQKRWADINSDSDDSVPFFTKTASIAGVNRPDDESYILPPVADLDNSKGCINMRLRTTDLCSTIAEDERAGKPEDRTNGENVNGAQLDTKSNARPPADFGSFNETWKPRPDAVEFHPMGLMESLPNMTSASSTKFNKKRARRVIAAGRVMLSGGGRHSTAGSSTSIGDSDSVAAESVSSMPRRKRTKKNSVCSDFGSIAGEELTADQLVQRVKTREKDVARWKSMGDYNRYLEVIPKEKRTPNDPSTPDPRTTMTKRKWKFNNELWQRSIKDRLKFDKEFPSLS